MYVCICNAINERSVKQAVADGARTAKQVYAHHDCTPCCGKCKPEIVRLIVDHAPPLPPCAEQDLAPAPMLDDLPLAAE